MSALSSCIAENVESDTGTFPSVDSTLGANLSGLRDGFVLLYRRLWP